MRRCDRWQTAGAASDRSVDRPTRRCEHIRIGRRNRKAGPAIGSVRLRSSSPLARVARVGVLRPQAGTLRRTSPRTLHLRRSSCRAATPPLVVAPDFPWLRWLDSSGFRSRKVRIAVRSDVGRRCALASRSPQTQLKRAREQALRERRERKQAKKEARAAERRARADGAVTDPEPTRDD